MAAGSLATLGALASRRVAARTFAVQQQPALRFPDDFRWGTATSSYQVEGAAREDGRGPSIWDTFSHTPGRIRDGSTGDAGADHYHRYKEDVALMKSLGARAYRFSIAWPRLFPEGTGSLNPKGLAFYDRLVDELLAAGIEPYATLYHWDLPQALQDKGGWQARDTALAFGDYAAEVARRLTDRVRHVFTLNEMLTFVEHGHASGVFAPGLKLAPAALNQVRHHAVLAHGLAVQAVRAQGRRGTEVGPAENMMIALPAVETPAHIRAAEAATREMNAPYLTVMLEGRYTDAYLAAAGADAPKFTARDLEIIASPVDFVGLNVYAPGHYVLASEAAPGWTVVPFPASYPHMASAWLTVGARGAVLGAAPCREAVGREGHLHHRERHLGRRPARARRHGLRRRPRDVPAQLPDAAAARDGRGRAGARLLPVEPARQLRMGRRLCRRASAWSMSTTPPRSARPSSARRSTARSSRETP